MAIMRVEKNSNYTVMANYHLRDKRLTLKAKGLLSVMISLPAEWDYTLAGLAYISKEGISAIRAAIQELEENGYVTRARLRNQAGQLGDTAYTIYEFPQNQSPENEQETSPAVPVSETAASPAPSEPMCDTPMLDQLTLDQPTLDKPTLDKPTLENPTLGFPTLENRTQLNKDRSNTYSVKKEKEINPFDVSHPYPSNIHPSIPETASPIKLPLSAQPVPMAAAAGTEQAALECVSKSISTSEESRNMQTRERRQGREEEANGRGEWNATSDTTVRIDGRGMGTAAALLSGASNGR